MSDIPLNSEFERVIEDPFVKFAQKWKREIVGVVVAGLLGAWAYSLVESARQNEREVAAQSFASVQRSYDELIAVRSEVAVKGKEEELKKKQDAAQAKLSAVLAALSDAGDAYKPLVAAYTSLAQGENAGNFASYAEGTSERFIAELAALGVARKLLDTDAQKAISSLKVIAHSAGAVARAGALDVLLTVAPADPEVQKLEAEAVTRFPEIKSVLEKITD